MTTEDDARNNREQTETERHRLVTLALTAAALGLSIAALVLGILRDDAQGTSPLLTIAVVALALNGLRSLERNKG